LHEASDPRRTSGRHRSSCRSPEVWRTPLAQGVEALKRAKAFKETAHRELDGSWPQVREPRTGSCCARPRASPCACSSPPLPPRTPWLPPHPPTQHTNSPSKPPEWSMGMKGFHGHERGEFHGHERGEFHGHKGGIPRAPVHHSGRRDVSTRWHHKFQ